MGTKISVLEMEHVKRVRALHLEPSQTGLTIIGGRNGQGKTSVTDGIAWALGGKKFEPTSPKHDQAMGDAKIKVVLNNGLVVERKGKNGELRVTDSAGKKAGQSLLDTFLPTFALNLPGFLNASKKDKAEILLNILGIGKELQELEQNEQVLYNRRHAVGQIANAKAKHAEELPEYPDAPDAPLSISDLIQQQQSLLMRNEDNKRKRREVATLIQQGDLCEREIARLSLELKKQQDLHTRILADLKIAQESAQNLQDESTAELERQIADFEGINAQVAANNAKAAAQDEAAKHQAEYNALSEQINDLRSRRIALLDGAKLPLPGLTVENQELLYNGKAWDCMSGSEQLRVAVAIVRKLQPDCGFVLVDKLEQFDMETLAEFAAWTESEGLQVIATRVSTGAECTIILEDGLPKGQSYVDVVTGVNTTTTNSPEAGEIEEF